MRGFKDGETLELGRHTLRFLETPHVHHWDSMMVVEEATNSLFPSDLFLQPGDQPPVVTENLSAAMCEVYRGVGIFAHETPVRRRVRPHRARSRRTGSTRCTAARSPATRCPPTSTALREHEFAYAGWLLGREVGAPAVQSPA